MTFLEVALGLAGALVGVGVVGLWDCGIVGLGLGFPPSACRSVNLRCWKMARVASAEGGAQVARDFLRQRSLSEARMLTTTVRVRGVGRVEVVGRGVVLVGERAGVGAGAPARWGR